MKLCIGSAIVLILMITGCGPDSVAPCTLDHLDGKSFVGQVAICNPPPFLTFHFQARAIATVTTDQISFQVESLDTFQFSEVVGLFFFECDEREPNHEPGIITYELLSDPGMDMMGQIYRIDIAFRISTPECNADAVFEGFLE